EPPDPALVVGCERHELQDPVDVPLLEARLQQPAGGAVAHEPLRTRARVQPVSLDADRMPDPACRRGRDPDDLHRVRRPEAGDGRPALAREARLDRDLGPQRVLPLEDVRGDVLGELLREQRLADHDLLDRLLEQLRKARHVHALLRRVEVDGALDVGGDELLVLAPAEADRLVDAADAGAREADPHLGGGRLQILRERPRVHILPRVSASTMAEDTAFPRLVSLACHDLRTPLATVSGFAKTLTRAGSLAEPADRYVAMIETAAGQMAELLDELGLVARIEAGPYDPALRATDTLELAQAAADDLGEERVAVS